MDLFGDPEPLATETAPPIENTYEEEGLLPPRESTLCLGHDPIENKLLSLFQSGKLAHGYVFSGPRGIGKATMAFRFARFLLNNADFNAGQGSLLGDTPGFTSMDIAPTSPVFRQIASGGHPDLFTVERAYDATKNTYKANVDVAQIRKIEPFLRKTSSYGGWRVVIVDDADTMNRNAQNALLKILEEPPEKTMIILVAHAVGTLLPTIRSRTQTLTFDPLSNENIEHIVGLEGHIASDIILDLAQGSAGTAIEHTRNNADEMIDNITELCEGGGQWSKRLSFAERTAKSGQGEDYKTFAMLCVWIFRRAAIAKARATDIPVMENRLKSFPLERLLGICDKLSEHFTTINSSNLDKKQSILQALALMS